MQIQEAFNAAGPAFFHNNLYVHGQIVGSGAFSLPYAAKTGAYTVTESDYAINVTSGTFTVALPTAVGISGRIYVIKNSGTGTVTVDASGTQTIDGSLTAVLYSRYSAVTIQSNGVNWVVIGVISPVALV